MEDHETEQQDQMIRNYDFNIRQARPTDLDIIVGMERKYFADMVPEDIELHTKILRSYVLCGNIWVAADHNNVTIGYMRVQFVTPACIPMIAVQYTKRRKVGRGIGSALYDNLCDYLYSLGYDRVLLSENTNDLQDYIDLNQLPLSSTIDGVRVYEDALTSTAAYESSFKYKLAYWLQEASLWLRGY